MPFYSSPRLATALKVPLKENVSLNFSYLNLTSAVPPKLARIQPHQSLEIGSKFKLMCYVERGSRPLHFSWSIDRMLNDGPQLQRREKIATTEEESILTIDRLDSIDAANYSCRVANEAGEDRLAVQLVVKSKSERD